MLSINPLLHSVPYMAFSAKFYFNLRRDNQSISYERCEFVSVDERAYLRLCSKKYIKKNSCSKGLTEKILYNEPIILSNACLQQLAVNLVIHIINNIYLHEHIRLSSKTLKKYFSEIAAGI